MHQKSFVPVSIVTSLLCQGLVIYFCGPGTQEIHDRHPVTEELQSCVRWFRLEGSQVVLSPRSWCELLSRLNIAGEVGVGRVLGT